MYNVGFSMNNTDPDYVVMGETRSYNFEMLEKATQLVLKGAKLIGCNFDTTGPVDGGIAPATRALISPIEMATGKQAYFVGKPNPLNDAPWSKHVRRPKHKTQLSLVTAWILILLQESNLLLIRFSYCLGLQREKACRNFHIVQNTY